MTTTEEERAVEQLAKLLDTQLLIRATVSRFDRRQSHQFCTIALVAAFPDLGRYGWLGETAAGFLHLVYYAGYEEHKGELVSSAFDFHSLKIDFGVNREEKDAWLQSHAAMVFKHWKDNITGDGPRPLAEWLEPKPFCGVACLGHRGEAHVETLKDDARPLLAYYGLLLGKLDSYLAQLKTLNHDHQHDPSHKQRLMLVSHMTERFRTFLHYRQLRLFDGVFA